MKSSVSDLDNSCNVEELHFIYDQIPDTDEYSSISSNFAHWQPLYDLYVVNDEVVITIEIAGVNVKDISLFVNKNRMVIKGIRRSASSVRSECCTFHNIEIPYGKFSRIIEFPAPVKPRQNHYVLDNGLLTLKFAVIKETIIPVEDEE